MSLLNNLGAAHDLTLHHHIFTIFSPMLHDDTGGGAAQREADGDDRGALLVPALRSPVVTPVPVPPLSPPLLV